MNIKKILMLAMVLILLESCASVKNFRYFQDVQTDVPTEVIAPKDIQFQSGDILSIYVSSTEPEMAALFNLRSNNSQGGGNVGGTNGNRNTGYTIDRNGEIQFPILGNLKIAGMTKKGVSNYIQSELKQRSLLKDPIVIVEYLNLGYSILGEINSPGRYTIDHDNYTIIDAISMAGDLSVLAKRNRILVMRDENGKRKSYYVNLCSAKELYSSPVYYMQQNDVVYIEPNSVKSRQSTVNGNNMYTPSFWMSMSSFLISIAFLIFK